MLEYSHDHLLKTFKVVEFDSNKGGYVHPLSVCKNNDCVIKPDFLFGGTIKFKIVNGMAILEDLHSVFSRRWYDIHRLGENYKLEKRYGYSIHDHNKFKYDMLTGYQDNIKLDKKIRDMQDGFLDEILRYIVPKYAKKARFKFCENAYYGCTCAKPCTKR